MSWNAVNWLEENRELLLAEWEAHLPADRWPAEVLRWSARAFEALVGGGSSAALEALAEELVPREVSEDAPAGEALELILQLKGVVYAALPPERLAETTADLEPAFDTFFRIVARAVDRVGHRLLQERLDAAEVLAQRLRRSTEEMDQAMLRLRTLFDISRVINLTQGGDLVPTLNLVAETLSSLSQVDRCSIWLADEQGASLAAVAVHGMGARSVAGLTLDPDRPGDDVDGTLGGVARAFVSLKPQMSTPRDDTAPAVFAVPLMDEYRVLGVLAVEGLGTSRGLTVALADLTQSVAEQLATAVRNSHLYGEIVDLNQQLEERVRERTRELSQVSRELAELDRKKSDFIAIAGHELKTPLTLLRGYAEMIEQMESKRLRREMWKPVVDGILRGTSRLDAIINDILSVAQIDNDVLWLSLDSLSVGKVLELACNEIGPGAEARRIRLELADLDGLPRIRADGTRLHQVFVNLLSNAIKYTPDDGWVRVHGRPQEGTNGVPMAIEIVIADSGVGIDPEDQRRIFDKFYRVGDSSRYTTSKTRFRGGGPGLGLTIARGVIEAHGGRIWVESPGHDDEVFPGSRFHVILPIAGPSQPE